MIWNLNLTETESLQEEYEKLECLQYDDTLGDAYKAVCAFKRAEIERELKKRSAQAPAEIEYCAVCTRVLFDTERVFLHNGQTVCRDCMEKAGSSEYV